MQNLLFTKGNLIQKEKQYIKILNQKNTWNVFKVLKSFKSKKTLPIYQDLALHKVVKDMWGIIIPKATISTWLSSIPELLEDDEEFNSIFEEKTKKIEIDYWKKLYTFDEWEYLHKCKTEALIREQKGLLTKLANPNLSDKQIIKLSWISQTIMKKINNFEINMSDNEQQDKIIQLTWDIVIKWLEKVKKEIWYVKVLKAGDIKAITSAITDVNNMNRLLTWQSTSNVEHLISQTYNAILESWTDDIIEAEEVE